MVGLTQAKALAIALPAALLGGAYFSEYVGGLYPCEMCWWQRYPHFAALGIGVLALFLKPQQVWVALAGLAILTSGAIGGYHAGVEYDWWPGLTGCSAPIGSVDVMNPDAASAVPCGEAAWTLFGISLAGYNFLISTLGGLVVIFGAMKGTKS